MKGSYMIPKTKNDVVNAQHDQIYVLANKVVDEDTLKQFLQFTKEHFDYEETLETMTKEHIEDHHNLLEDIEFLISTKSMDTLNLEEYFREVLIEHILNHDINL